VDRWLVSSPMASVVFLAIGAWAIFQVVVAIEKFIIQSSGGRLMTGPNVAGLTAGTLMMYLTSLLI
jgi:ZIP family zinc transporter